MVNTKHKNNIRLFALQNVKDGGFDVYIDCSGSREYLMYHRRNSKLFSVLKYGVTLDELERCKRRMISDISLSSCRMSKGEINPKLKSRKNFSKRIENSINYLIEVANEYLGDYIQAA